MFEICSHFWLGDILVNLFNSARPNRSPIPCSPMGLIFTWPAAVLASHPCSTSLVMLPYAWTICAPWGDSAFVTLKSRIGYEWMVWLVQTGRVPSKFGLGVTSTYFWYNGCYASTDDSANYIPNSSKIHGWIGDVTQISEFWPYLTPNFKPQSVYWH